VWLKKKGGFAALFFYDAALAHARRVPGRLQRRAQLIHSIAQSLNPCSSLHFFSLRALALHNA
jgi:hypothetical protein